MVMSQEFRAARIELIARKIGKQSQSTGLGRHFDTSDVEGRREFAEWYLDVADQLGLIVAEK